MYRQSKPIDNAIRAEKPSYTPGQTSTFSFVERYSRSFVAAGMSFSSVEPFAAAMLMRAGIDLCLLGSGFYDCMEGLKDLCWY